MSQGLKDLIACCVLVALITWLLGVFGPALDQKTAAQVQAAVELDRDLKAAAFCRREFGEASMVHTERDEIVCIPRRGKSVTASNY